MCYMREKLCTLTDVSMYPNLRIITTLLHIMKSVENQMINSSEYVLIYEMTT